ncbi:MAG: hypothetical protein KJP00_06930 [Bacteroidia bacterium]|nr:hypothetical protein [Bacteroidia bacterium]
MKKLQKMTTMTFKNKWNRLAAVLFMAATITLMSCEKDPDEIVDEFGININDLYGKWSFTGETEVVTDASGTIVEEETKQFAHNMMTIEFNENQTFQFIDVESVEWGDGSISVDDAENNVDLNFDTESTTFHIVSMSSTTAEIEIVEEETEDGQVFTTTSTIQLTKNSGTEPGIEMANLWTKWSMGSNDIYINDVLITADLLEGLWMETVSTIDDDMYTLELNANNTALSIDNYMTGTYSEGEVEFLDKSNYVVELDGYEEPFLFHITANDGNGGMTVIHFIPMEQVNVKVEQEWTNVFDESTLDANLLAGDWEVTAKTDGREVNGSVATPEGEGPEVGNILKFYSNGSGEFGQDQFTFTFLDDSNMSLISAGETEYTLIHFVSFNGTNEMTVWNMYSEYNETTGAFEQEWLQMDLVKQE